MKISLCLLVFNELRGCEVDVSRLPVSDFDEVYAMDGGSSDGTVEYLRKSGIVVHRQQGQGLNAACVSAFAKCTTDAVVFFHPKGTIPPEDLKKFPVLLRQGFQVVVGSRNIAGARNEEDGRILRPRKLFVHILSVVSAFFWRTEGEVIWDVLHGFRAMTKESFDRINLKPKGLTVDLEMVIRAYQLNLKRVEFPTTESPRLFGETRFKALPAGWQLMTFLVRETLQNGFRRLKPNSHVVGH